MVSAGHFIGAVVGSVLSLCGPVICFLTRRHVEYEHWELRGRRVFCERCSKTLEVGP